MSDPRLVSLAGALASQACPPHRTLEKAAVPSDEATWAATSLLEAGGWLCVGVEVGLYPREAARQALEGLFGAERRLWDVLPKDERSSLVGSGWAEALVVGRVDQALEIGSVTRSQKAPEALRAAFGSARIKAERWAGEPGLGGFLRRLRLAADEEWRGSLERGELLEEAILSADDDGWRRIAITGHPFDDLIGLLQELETWGAWRDSTLGLGRLPGFWPGEGGTEPAFQELVRSVGRLQRWKLDLAVDRVGTRLRAMVEEADGMMPELLEAVGASPSDAWPEGFARTFEKALRTWDQLSGEMSGKYTDPSDSGGGGGGERRREEEREEVVKEKVPQFVGA